MSAADEMAKAFRAAWTDDLAGQAGGLAHLMQKLMDDGVLRPAAATLHAIPFALDPDKLLGEVKDLLYDEDIALSPAEAAVKLLLDWMLSGGRMPAEIIQAQRTGPIAWREQAVQSGNAHMPRHWRVEGEDAVTGHRYQFIRESGQPWPPAHSRQEAGDLALVHLLALEAEGQADRVFLVCPDNTQELCALAPYGGPGQPAKPLLLTVIQSFPAGDPAPVQGSPE